jgi:hypothetical protein
MSLCIFDSYGHVSKSISPDEVEALDDATRDTLMSTLTACRAAEQKEIEIADLRKSVALAVQLHTAALAAYDVACPPVTHQQALLAVIAANDPTRAKPKRVKPTKAVIEATATRDAAIASLIKVKLAFDVAQFTLRGLNKARGAAIVKWAACLPHVTPEMVTREYINHGVAERVAIANGEMPAPVVPEPPHRWPLEIAMAAKKKPRVYHGQR